MLRTEQPRVPIPRAENAGARFGFRDLLLAVAPPPQPHAYPLSMWPSWLVPAYRSGGHRPEVRLLEEER
jgi:hypothetical protein